MDHYFAFTIRENLPNKEKAHKLKILLRSDSFCAELDCSAESELFL